MERKGREGGRKEGGGDTNELTTYIHEDCKNCLLRLTESRKASPLVSCTVPQPPLHDDPAVGETPAACNQGDGLKVDGKLILRAYLNPLLSSGKKFGTGSIPAVNECNG